MPGERTFQSYLTRSSWLLLFFLLLTLLTGIYFATNRAIRLQQERTTELNNRNSVIVLDAFQQTLFAAMTDIAAILAADPGLEADPAGPLANAVQTLEATTGLDMLRFVSPCGKHLATLDTSIYDLSAVSKQHLLEATHATTGSGIMLQIRTGKGALLRILAGSKQVIHPDSGKVLGTLIGGMVLNDALPLVRELALRTSADYSALLAGDEIITSSRSLPPAFLPVARTMGGGFLKTTLQTSDGARQMIISRQAYPLAGPEHLYFLHFYQDTLGSWMQRTFLLAGALMTLAVCSSFFLFYFLTNQRISRAMGQLLDFTQQAADPNREVRYLPGPFSEFNRIGDAVEEMVTLLARSREALANEQALLLALINSIPDPIFYKDRAGVYFGCNAAFEAFAGKKENELIGKTDLDLFPAEVAAFFREQDKEMILLGQPRRNEEWVTYPSGQRVLMDTLKTPFVGPDGHLLGLIGVSRDITRLKEIEKSLEDERERLRVTLRSIGDAVLTTDTEGKILFLNKVAEELTGWSSDEAVGLPSSEVFCIINENSGEKYPSPVQRVLELGRIMGMANHCALVARDGTRRSIADSGAPIRDRDSRIIGVVIVFRDITKERKTEEELLKVKKLQSLGILAGGIAHDFNNILSGILGNIELAALQTAGMNPETTTLLADARKATQRATRLTKQLLTFSKGGEPVRATTALPELVRESADFVLSGSNISCDYSFAPDLWNADIDGGQISQVIQNIVINAKQAMPGGGRIRIACCNVADVAAEALLNAQEGAFIRLTIEDSGVGMPQEVLEKIFDPYFTTKQMGSGLGLAICHSIIGKHDGYITVQSTPGRGSLFTIYLPASSGAYAAQQTATPGKIATRALRVMVMDDEAMLREMMERQLTALGHEPLLVTDGDAAIKLYQNLRESGTPVDLVLMDLTIPGGKGGLETATELLKLDPSARLIVSSGYSTDPVMSHFREYGFKAAVEKPASLASLGKALDQALR